MGNVPSNGSDEQQPQEQQKSQQSQLNDQQQQTEQQQQQPQQQDESQQQQQQPNDDKKNDKQAKKAKKAAAAADEEPKVCLTEEQITEMREKEDGCAACPNPCEILTEYPDYIADKIDHTVTLWDSGKLHRWHILISTGVSATRWPSDCFSGDWFPKSVNDATNKLDTKVRVSVMTREPESGCNPQEATDIIIFPEFVKYCDVTREQLDDLLKYHTEVVGPRHQAYDRHCREPETNPLPTKPELTAEQQQSLDELDKPTPDDISHYVHPYDRVEFGAGTKFPYPIDLKITTAVFFCGHQLRDKRCGVTAPILMEQFDSIYNTKYPEKRALLDMDLISHTGGHKFAGNVICYDKSTTQPFGVFYGRVYPKHCEAIIDALQKGEVLQPLVRATKKELW